MEDSNVGNEPNSEEDDETGLNTHYPSMEGLMLLDEEVMTTENGTRSFMTYSVQDGEKEFVIIQEPAVRPENKLPVSVEGDPVDLGFTIGALTENSLRWESAGISFFIASDTLSQDEMIEVAASMTEAEVK